MNHVKSKKGCCIEMFYNNSNKLFITVRTLGKILVIPETLEKVKKYRIFTCCKWVSVLYPFI